MSVADSVVELIGNTPMIRLKNASIGDAVVYGKCEFLNPTHSVKDRIGANIILEALKSNKIDKNSTILEATSGNTGIALASVCASLGLKLILAMPSSMSKERQKLLRGLGAELILTDAKLGMKGSIDKIEELSKKIKNSYIANQFENPLNPSAHIKTTALEIYDQTKGEIDIFVAGVGTGGTISGIGEVLKKMIPGIRVIAVEPARSAVISGDKPSSHKIQGIGAGFIPKNLNLKIIDEVFKVKDEEAINMARELAKKEGLLVGISSGANVFASKMIASKKENRGKKIVTILCDTAERYLSSGIFDDD